jgi:IS30 family transposase
MTKLMPDVCQKVVAAKLAYNYGPEKMRRWLSRTHGVQVSATALYKFYRRRHLIRKPQKQLRWYTPLKEPFVATIPGENVQLDVKYVPERKGSWVYQYRFLDQATNLQFAKDYPTRDGRTSIRALREAGRAFPFACTGIQTDNGGEFRGSFHRALVRRHIMHRFIPKRSAPWNGKVERANRSVDDEYYLNTGRPWKTLAAYTAWYNHERPHLGKGMDGMTPYQKYLTLAAKVLPLKVY